jgi:threonine dehydratase
MHTSDALDRNSGGDYGRVLVALQIVPDQKEKYEKFLQELKKAGYYMIVDETSNPVYRHFLK